MVSNAKLATLMIIGYYQQKNPQFFSTSLKIYQYTLKDVPGLNNLPLIGWKL